MPPPSLPDIREGAEASLTRRIEEADVQAFADLTGDRNPVHLDEAYAAGTRFGRRIAHGVLVAGHISAVLGTLLPGPGSIYLGQTLAFKAPVHPGDIITSRVVVTRIRPDKPIVTLQTTCLNQDGQVVLEGEATLLCPSLAEGPQYGH
jgi:3-hydroxybutyryl-CoA dehydratase